MAIGTPDTGYVVPKGTTVRVSAHGTCKKVNNSHASNNYFFGAKVSPEWSTFRGTPPSGVSFQDCDYYSRSCLDYLRQYPGSPSGDYTIDPDGAGVGTDPFTVYCDMEMDGGGWTLVWSNTRAGSNKPVTNISWNEAMTTLPRCSEANGSGVGCGYSSDNKEDFNFFIGLDWWGRITEHRKNIELLYQWSPDYGEPIQQAAKMNYQRANTSLLYPMVSSNPVSLVGGIIPGIHTLHGVNRMLFSASDLDNDIYHNNCSGDQFSGTPWWYTNCWSGSISGGGEINQHPYLNGAHFTDSTHAWGQPNGQGAGNGWIYIREYEYPANCTEIKSKVPEAPSGIYWIDPDGVGGRIPVRVQCDMTSDGGGWTLIFNQKVDTGGYFANASEVELQNEANPTADKYSILNRMESFRSLKGDFTFRMSSPSTAIRNIWKQQTNPTVDQSIRGFVAISIATPGNFLGLERNCTAGCADAFMDGSPGSNTWWGAIGTYHVHDTGIPLFYADNYNQAQLWVRDDSFLLSTPRDCQDILEFGQSQGNGLYWVDPTNAGYSTQVYCDMEKDGGGWTLVFNQNVVGGFFTDANDALSRNSATPTADLYSILDNLDNFKANGRYIFRINWPGYVQRNIWVQTTNPTIDQPVSGYAPLSVDLTGSYWGGLERNCGVSCGSSLMDGSVGISDWWFGVGSYAAYWGGIPAASFFGGDQFGVPQTQLWTRRSEGQFTKRSCKEIRDAGLSTGDGMYVIDPDGVGGQPGVRVYCVMDTNGGGWTRVAYNWGSSDTTTIPGDFFVNTYRRDLIGIRIVPNSASSLNPEWFSKVVGTTDAMLSVNGYVGTPFIDNGLGTWDYDQPRCSGTLVHSGRNAGCPGQNGNDDYQSADRFNIGVYGGSEALVPNWRFHGGPEVCYSGKGSCDFEFYLR